MAVLLFPLLWLSSPRTVKDAGGKLAQLRTENQLGQADLGDIDPASETMKLATLGLRGVAVNLLWNQANHLKKTENWSKLTATLDQLAKLQPNFITFWKYQSWNQSYNLSVEFDDYRDRYYYVRRGIEFLEEGEKYNRDNPQLLWELGWFAGQKIGRSDEKIQYRRLFKADDEYHGPRDRAGERRDNWIVSKDWYDEAENAADVVGRGIGRKSPLVFYSSSPKSQMNYAEAIEEEGQFGKAETAWKRGEEDWVDFGAREVEHSQGVLLQLGNEAALAEEVDELNNELTELAPEAFDAFVSEREAKLTEEERAALAKPYEQRRGEEFELAAAGLEKTAYTPFDLAERIGEEEPDLRVEAAQLAADIDETQRRLKYTRSYKQTANYDYWLTRSQFEQTEDAIKARQLIFRGRKAFRKDLDPVEAKRLYEEGLARWRKVLDAYPVLLDEDGNTGEDVFIFIEQYNRVLQQLDEEIPDDFPLWDIIENFDTEQKLVEELAAYKERTQANEQGSTPGDSSSAGEPEPAEPGDADADDAGNGASDASDSPPDGGDESE